jgi:DNA primase
VSPEKQFYHCFGCGAHGTVLRFLMEYDRMAFPEAVEELASRLGLTVPHEGGARPETGRADESLYELMAEVAKLYSDALAKDERARSYVARRGLTRETVERFCIGYAPDSWNAVLRHFGAREAGRRALAELGLIVERGRSDGDAERYYDRFRDRIMFPIRDSRGRPIAFGGRIIDRGEPKYLNSPETALFHKGRELYGLYETRLARSGSKRLLVVEGYMDAVRLHQCGISDAVATLGTATTAEHFKRLFRLVSEVIFAFDGDRAGRAAAWRALQQALPEAREGREIRFLFLPEGEDPDSLVGAEGREAFERRLDATLPLSEYLVRELSEQTELDSADGRARFAASARPLVEKVPEGVYRDLLLARIAEVVGLAPERLSTLWARRESAERPDTKSALAALPPRTGRGEAQRNARTRFSAGRGSLVRQAIARLVRFPAAAAAVSDEERDGLTGCEERGIELLRELLDDLRAHPLTVSAQVLERWAEKPGGEHLGRLLEREEVLGEEASAIIELKAALTKLADQAAERRLQALEAKSRSGRLETHEIKELQRLMRKRAPRDRGGS